ncbi:MAG TPA: four helix bundle protein [Thermoanaerobaculia bacterium]|nr:four helix bundle protein [Thermoanaerobaculia bacterium]
MGSFEDLRVFQRAIDLMVDVYTATEAFPKAELYGLTSQMRRASCSVVSNVAEGQGRLSYGETRQLLSQARGSLFEVQAQVIVANRLGFLNDASAEHLKKRIRAAGRELAGLIEWIKRREAEAKRPSRKKPQTPDT